MTDHSLIGYWGALTIFQSYGDLEAGYTQSLKSTRRDRESNPQPLAQQAKSLTTPQSTSADPNILQSLLTTCSTVHQILHTIYRENLKFRPRFIFALFALWPEGEFKTGIIQSYNFFIKDYVRNLEHGEFKTGRISLKSKIGENKTGWIQSCIRYKLCTVQCNRNCNFLLKTVSVVYMY